MAHLIRFSVPRVGLLFLLYTYCASAATIGTPPRNNGSRYIDTPTTLDHGTYGSVSFLSSITCLEPNSAQTPSKADKCLLFLTEFISGVNDQGNEAWTNDNSSTSAPNKLPAFWQSPDCVLEWKAVEVSSEKPVYVDYFNLLDFVPVLVKIADLCMYGKRGNVTYTGGSINFRGQGKAGGSPAYEIGDGITLGLTFRERY